MKLAAFLSVILLLSLPIGAFAATDDCSVGEETLRQQALDSTHAGPSQTYLSCHPFSDSAQLIRLRLRKLTEDAECKTAMKSGAKETMMSFIRKYSASECALEMARNIKTITPARQYHQYRLSLFGGRSFARKKTNTATQCAAQCDEVANRCVGYSYYDAQKACFLFSNIVDFRRQAGVSSGSIAEVSEKRTVRYKRFRDSEIRGGTYQEFRRPDLAACAATCTEDSRCRAFSYFTINRTCQLKFQFSRPVGNRNVWSGFKQVR